MTRRVGRPIMRIASPGGLEASFSPPQADVAGYGLRWWLNRRGICGRRLRALAVRDAARAGRQGFGPSIGRPRYG
jgi:hypothetical protein